MNKGIPLLNDNMNYWIKTNQAPVQMERVLRVSLMDARRKEEHQMSKLTDADFYTIEEAKQERERLMKRHKIEIDKDFFNSDQ